ncbi:MAG: 1,4-alpha-glucan branching protein GlgB [Rhodothermales bacterium]
MPRLTRDDFYYWNEGTSYKSYEKLGAHPNRQGTWFAVWAPYADQVFVIGDFNDWQATAPMRRVRGGLWETYVRGAKPGQRYKYRIHRGLYQADKADPYAFRMEPPTAHGSAVEGLSSIIDPLNYSWNDRSWMDTRTGPGLLHQPLSIYEVHLGSWMHRRPGTSLGYRDIAEPLADHVETMGFTHVEFLPLAEHPFYGSWGYQIVGYFAPTFRYGAPQDLMYLIDYLHQRGIGVLLDWVPAHFAADPQGLVFFDGSTLFEYDDPKMRHHPDWGTYVFDYNKPGVRNFLISNALFWLDKYHIDGLRVDAVASMLYRDYSRDDWSPNLFGGRENLEAIDLLKKTNETIYSHFPSAITVAEESTAFPGVSAPTYHDGLGFLFKWNMGWMHDTLDYMHKDPVHRQFHHDDLTFSLVYAFSEHYTLPLSHDEVVHGKGSLWGKMPGDAWQKAANLRLLYGHMFGHPGKKLLFMGNEFGQEREWNHDRSIDWHVLDDPLHRGLMRWVADLNALYRTHPALWNDELHGFAWIVGDDRQQSVLCYQRTNGDKRLIFVLNFTPILRESYRIGVPESGVYLECLNSDAALYGGSGLGNRGRVESTLVPCHGRPVSLELDVPPLGMLVLEKRG